MTCQLGLRHHYNRAARRSAGLALQSGIRIAEPSQRVDQETGTGQWDTRAAYQSECLQKKSTEAKARRLSSILRILVTFGPTPEAADRDLNGTEGTVFRSSAA